MPRNTSRHGRAGQGSRSEGSGQRLSWLRVLTAMLLTVAVGAASYGAVAWVKASQAAAAAPKPWFAPYVDVTVTPQHPFETPKVAAAKQVVLGFVVASPTESCTPTWGSTYTLGAAATGLDLDRRIARLRQRGGDVVVSFGGQANVELGTACKDVGALSRAYQAVVDRYRVTTIDLDLETASLADASADSRRADAIRTVQQTARASGRSLAVWLTLPVSPSGLGDRGLAVVASMLAAHVDVAGVNVMTMDYGQSLGSLSESAATARALQATHRQLSALYRRASLPLSDQAVWGKLGATPMIGQNDEVAERFDLRAASDLVRFAQANGLRRISMWSLNRDTACGPNYVDLRTVSNLCSGLAQSPLAFAKVFGALTGRVDEGAAAVTTPDAHAGAADDPAHSPYPIWKAAAAYVKGTKIVWHHNVYRAKWWTRGDAPDEPVLHEWDTPWQLVGPVLPGDHPYVQPTLPAGTYPEWSAMTTYVKGERVLYHGVGYEAKWWTQGDLPGADVLDPGDTPWAVLTAPATPSPAGAR